jgi:hypothetical protein
VPSPVPTTTGVPAQQVPLPDPASVIAAQEQGLAEYLNRPVQEILAQLGYPPAPGPAPVPGAPPPGAEPPPPGNPMDPGALIKPVTDALGTLGTGIFEAIDPTQMFSAISQAVDSSGAAVAPAMNSLPGNWEGRGATAATAKTVAALRNGEEVSAQAANIRSSVTSAATAVKQAEARLLEIISRFQATVAAIGPNIIFPWGQAALLAAATEAVTRAGETMTELQATLAGETNTVTAAGAPVAVTEAPAAAGGGDMMSQLLGAFTKGAQSGVQTATDMASSLGESAASGTAAATTPVGTTAAAAPLSKAGGSSAGTSGGMGGGGGGGAGGFANTLSARSAPPMPAVSEDVGRATPASSARPAGLGTGMYPPGMMGAPMAGAHGGQGGRSDHTAAAFLHTTENGREIVGDLGAAAPPVLGEADPPKVQKRAT